MLVESDVVGDIADVVNKLMKLLLLLLRLHGQLKIFSTADMQWFIGSYKKF